MKSAAKNIQLASYDDLFKTDEERQADTQERVQNLPLDKLEPFPNHPFKVIDDDKMLETVESIKERGVLVPILVRPKNDGNFEIVSGHRRHHASQLAGLTEIPAIVREMDDDTAILLMVDSNLQREELLPSEKAFAYTKPQTTTMPCSLATMAKHRVTPHCAARSPAAASSAM